MHTKLVGCVLSVTRDTGIPLWVVGPQQLHGILVREARKGSQLGRSARNSAGVGGMEQDGTEIQKRL